MEPGGELIERIPSVVDGDEIRVPHTETHQWSMSSDGRRWARKRVLTTGSESLLAEALCSLLAERLDLQVPAGAVFVDAADSYQTSWLSRQVLPVTHWIPNRVAMVTNLADLGGLLVLDVLTMNEDRHGGNLLFSPDPTTYIYGYGESTLAMRSSAGPPTI